MPTLNINGKDTLVGADPTTPILWALRDTLGMTGTKFGCGVALCGACTVHLDGVATRSCVTPISAAVGKKSPPSKPWAPTRSAWPCKPPGLRTMWRNAATAKAGRS